jgi:arginyl-tRNA synthetase
VLLAPPAEKIIVEHTNINPNKAAHIGHLRNAVLGDTLVRMLRELGNEVEAQNYIDNTGVQVADVVAGFHFLEKKAPAEVQRLIDDPSVRFDYYCWDLYARTSQHYTDEPASLPWRAQTLHAIEAGEGELAELGRIVAGSIVNYHLDTMLRIGVEYDVLPRESEILHLKFWFSAFELLKQRQAIYLETEGKNKGCWVMPAHLFQQKQQEEGAEKTEVSAADGAEASTTDGAEAPVDAPADDSKVIVRSDGTVTYVGKDIAYQLWKFGLLDKDFHYAPLRTYSDGRTLWVSSTQPGERKAPRFGGGSKVFNVIDVRQSYLQDVVRAGLRSLGYERQAENSIHFSYEMVALSPRCCADLGIELSEEDRRKPYVEVSGRKGLGVKADDLIDRLIAKALEEVRSRHPDEPEPKLNEIATQIAIGALRYFMLRFTRTTVIAFDLQEALSFEGETGPYVQYAVVRARNILRKLEERGEAMPDFNRELTAGAFARQLENEAFWQILLGASRCDWTIEKSIEGGEPAHLARYAFQIAQAFNNFYHQHHILSETDREKKVFLLWMTRFFLDELAHVLGVMGIPAPEVM